MATTTKDGFVYDYSLQQERVMRAREKVNGARRDLQAAMDYDKERGSDGSEYVELVELVVNVSACLE